VFISKKHLILMENFSISLYTYFAVFISGVFVSLTPCVYPLIPVIVGYIGSREQKSKFSSFLLSVAYVFGMAITYTILGAIASLSGSMFGRIQSNPITNIVVGSIILIMGLWMIGIIKISLPIISAPNFSKKGILPAIAIGFVSGFIAAPCTTPVLATILTYVASKQNILFGTTLLFVYAFGMGILLIIAGTFTGMVIPKSGKWMIIVNKVFGFIFIALGLYFALISVKDLVGW